LLFGRLIASVSGPFPRLARLWLGIHSRDSGHHLSVARGLAAPLGHRNHRVAPHAIPARRAAVAWQMLGIRYCWEWGYLFPLVILGSYYLTRRRCHARPHPWLRIFCSSCAHLTYPVTTFAGSDLHLPHPGPGGGCTCSRSRFSTRSRGNRKLAVEARQAHFCQPWS